MSDANIAEQNEEMEVLASIYPDEFKMLDGDKSFKILLKPNPDGDDNYVIVSLVCELPDTYPSDSSPVLKIQIEKGLSANQSEELKELADRVALENLGAPSIFAVAEAVKEWLVDNNIAGQDGSMYSEMMRRMQQKDIQQKKETEKAAIKHAADSEFKEVVVDQEELERIRKRQAGTAVTVETFTKWKAAFDEEMALKELENLRAGAGSGLAPLAAVTVGAVEEGSLAAKAALETLASDGRPTGKQFFLLNMGGKGTAEEGEDPDAEETDGPDAFSQALEHGRRAQGEDSEDEDDEDSDYVDDGEEDEDEDYEEEG